MVFGHLRQNLSDNPKVYCHQKVALAKTILQRFYGLPTDHRFRSYWPSDNHDQVLLSLLVRHIEAGCLGAGSGTGSCAAAPFRF